MTHDNRPVTDAPETSLRDNLLSEVIKIATHPTSGIALLIATLANAAIAAIEAAGVIFYTGASGAPATISSFGLVTLAPVYAFLVVPALMGGGEYKNGQIRVTMSASPHRLRLFLAKCLAAGIVSTLTAIACLLPRTAIAIVSSTRYTEGVADLGLSCVAYTLLALLTFGLSWITRSVLVAIATLVAVPVFVATGVVQQTQIIRLLPDQAALSLVGTPGYSTTAMPTLAAAGVLLAWSGLAMTAALALFVVRDA